MRYIFLGDSITDAGRLWLPEYKGLGNGYVSMIAGELEKRAEDAEVINKGYDGFTAARLSRNVSTDCILKKPDVVCLLVGVNDVGIYHNTGMTLEEQGFAQHYESIVRDVTEWTDARMFCIGPFIFPKPQRYALRIPEVKRAEETEAAIARKYGVPFLPIHDKLNEYAQKTGIDTVTIDGIHLTETGHAWLADEILRMFDKAFAG